MTFNFVDGPEVVYTVMTEFRRGDDAVDIYKGTNYNRAVEMCNYWDEKQNTWLHVERLPMDALSVAMRKFDALEAYIWAKADRIGRGGMFAGECYVPPLDTRGQLFIVMPNGEMSYE